MKEENDLFFVGKDDFFTWVRKRADSAFQPTGKWIFHNHPKHLAEIVTRLLVPYIDSGEIEVVKFRHSYNESNGRFRHLLPPICIYADEGSKERIRDI